MDYIISQIDHSIAIVRDMGYDTPYLMDMSSSNDLLTTKIHYYLINIKTLTYSAKLTSSFVSIPFKKHYCDWLISSCKNHY